MVDIENLKRLRELRRKLSNQAWERLQSNLLDPQMTKEFRNYDYGLTNEEEFRFILRLLKHVAKVETINQAGRRPGQPIAPDYLVVFKKRPDVADSDRSATITAFVEVKRAWASTFRWHISKKDFELRRKYATQRGGRLFFAVKFVSHGWGLWTMFTSEYIESRGLRINLSDLRNSIFDFLSSNLQLHLPACEIEMVYDSERTGPVLHLDKGGLVELRIRMDGKIIETETSSLWRWLLFAFSPSNELESTSGSRTVVTKSYLSQIVPLYHAVDALMCALHQLDDDVERVNFRLNWLEGKSKSLVSVEAVFGLALVMREAGVLQPFRLMPSNLLRPSP